MRRALFAGAAVIVTAAALLAVLVVSAARGDVPVSCTWPAAADNFQAVAGKDWWTATHHNKLLCAINRLQAWVLSVGQLETVCANTTVPAATRQLVSLPLSASITASAPAFGTVIDTTNPSRLEINGVQSVSGTTVAVWVFNRDGAAARSGKVCAMVRR